MLDEIKENIIKYLDTQMYDIDIKKKLRILSRLQTHIDKIIDDYLIEIDITKD